MPADLTSSPVQLSGIQPELYSVYQAVKAISTGSRNITLADLASPELVTDEAFHLIVCALLLAKYGDVILNFEGSKVMRYDDGSRSEQRRPPGIRCCDDSSSHSQKSI